MINLWIRLLYIIRPFFRLANHERRCYNTHFICYEVVLATIQVDTDGAWLRRLNQFALRIDGRLALDEKIDVDEKITAKEILVSPGQA